MPSILSNFRASAVLSLPALMLIALPSFSKPADPSELETHQAQLKASNTHMRALENKRQAQMALDSMDPATRDAWKRYISKSYSDSAAGKAARKKDFLRLQRDWVQVQAEAHKGNITVEENSRFLSEHAENIKKRMIKAGKKNNLGVSMQVPSGKQKGFSDNDGHGRPVYRNQDKSTGKAGEMTVEQFTGARTDFNEQFNRDLAAAGLNPVDNPSQSMRSDIMPITKDKQLFQGVERKLNPDGAVMYQDPNAVNQEGKNRIAAPDGGTLGDSTDTRIKAAYMSEQIRQQRGHAIEAQHMLDEGNRILANPQSTDVERRRALRLLEQSQGEGSSLIGKYEDRHITTNEQARGQSSIDSEGMPISDKRRAAIEAVGNRRDLTVTQQSAEIMSTTENAIANQQIDGVRTFVGDEDFRAAAEISRNADASTRGRLIEEARMASQNKWEQAIRNKGVLTDPAEIRRRAAQLADRDAARLASEMRANAIPDTFDAPNNRWDINSTMNRPTNRQRVTEGIGTAMEGVDIFNAGQDLKDYNDGKMSGRELAESLGGRVPIVGDAYGAGKAIGQRAKDLSDAYPAVQGANTSIQTNWTEDTWLQARRQGATQEEASAIREALSAGNWAAAQRIEAALNARGIDYEIPAQPGPYQVEPDEGYAVDGGVYTGLPRRIWNTGKGILDSAYRAGQFVTKIPEDIVKAGAAAAGTARAEMDAKKQRNEQIGMAAALRRNLEEKGIDPDRALAIAQSFANGDNQPLIALRQERRRAAEAATREAEAMTNSNELSQQLLDAADESNIMQQMVLPEADEYATAFSSAEASNQQLTNEEFVMSSPNNQVAVTDLDQFLQEQHTQEQAAEQALRQNAETATAAEQSAWANTMQGIDDNMLAQDQQNLQSVQASQAQGTTLLQAAAGQNDPRISAADFNTQMSGLQREQDRLQQEQNQILSGANQGTSATTPLDPNKGGQYGGAAIAAVVAGDETGFDVRQAKCDDVVKAAGGNNPASVTVNLGSFGGSVAFTYDHYGVKDRIAVVSSGGILFDSGCASNTGGSTLNVPMTGQVKVVVEPNCDKTSDSKWEFLVACPAGATQ